MGAKHSSPVRIIRPSDGVSDDEPVRTGSGLAPSQRSSLSADPDAVPFSISPSASAKGLARGGVSSPESSKVGLRSDPASGVVELEDHTGARRKLSVEVVNWFRQRNSETLQGSLAFVPWILQSAFFEAGLDDKVIIHRGTGAVVFSDASGFTALTERLAKKSNGAELLSQCLTAFFTPLINLINAYRGDVIKFSGDALTIYFPAVDDGHAGRSRMQVPPHGSYGLPDLGPMATAVLRASACCIEIHKRLHMFDTGVDGVKLCLHIGVGCGHVTILQVGGVVPPETHVPRFEYIVAGPPLEQISIAEPLAKNGETCLSPQAWEYIKDCVIEDTSRNLENDGGFHLLLRLDESKYTFPTIKYSAMERDLRHEKQFKLSELNVIRRYIPAAVFKQIEGGTLTYVNEMRHISTIFIGGAGVDVSTDSGALVAQDLMSSVQRICYAHEGTLNKFVIDDKGMLFLLVFGLPPLVHTDDPTRAVLSCFEMSQTFQRFKLTGKFGVTTGRAYCGVCGSAQRMEYTVLGDTVNLSARLMSNAPKDGVLIDETTYTLCSREIECEQLQPIKVKGKANAINIFVPRRREAQSFIGLDLKGTIHFPWYERPVSVTQMTQETLAESLKENVVQLCSLSDWEPITKVESLTGAQFMADLHRKRSPVPREPKVPVGTLPSTSPFASGGVIIVEGHAGMGSIEIAEHMVTHAAMELGMLPIVGTVGPRVTDQVRLGVELLRSTAGAYRHLDPSLPESDLEVLERIVPPVLQDAFTGLSPAETLQQVREAFENKLEEDKRRTALFALADLVAALLESLRKRAAVIVVMHLDVGTNLFAKTLEGFSPFWTVVTTFSRMAMQEAPAPGEKPLVLAVMVKEADRNNPVVKRSAQRGWLIECKPLQEALCNEYMATYLQAPQDMVPTPLLRFVAKISVGNPLYIRETVDQLRENEYLRVLKDEDGRLRSIQYNQDLENINIAAWNQTAMVGNTICLLESLDPLEAAVLKMSTCFVGAFTLRDLAASTCSRWAGATHLDSLRLFCAVQSLVRNGHIIEVPRNAMPIFQQAEPIPQPQPEILGPVLRHAFAARHAGGATVAATAELAALSGDGPTTSQKDHSSGLHELQAYEMRNVLIRKVGGAMVLEAQKKMVKRQALIDRALSRDLPARMEEVLAKRLEPHIPWYYENVLAPR